MTPPYKFETTAEEIAGDCADHIRDRVILTTGVSPGGLGASFVETIAKQQPKLLILAGRDPSKAEMTARAISANFPDVQTRVLELDLSSQGQVRKAAQEVNTYDETIDVLVNNAGIMACPYSTTTDGLESQFATMHVGHFLFTNLIMGKILAAGHGSRIISVSSDGYRLSPIRFYDLGFRVRLVLRSRLSASNFPTHALFQGGETYDKWRAYGQAKTANMLFAVSLAEKLGDKGLLAFSLHPGVISTNLSRHSSQSDFAGLS